MAMEAKDEGLVSTLTAGGTASIQQKLLPALIKDLVATDKATLGDETHEFMQRVILKTIDNVTFETKASKLGSPLVTDRMKDIVLSSKLGADLLVIACQAGEWDVASALLQSGADPSLADGLLRVILKQTQQRDKSREVLNQAIKAGCDVNQVDENGVPPLVTAISSGNVQLASQLLEVGADMSKGNPVFALLKRLGHAEHESEEWEGLQDILDLLLEQGVDVTQPGPEGYSAYDMALVIGDKEVAKLLVLAGADLENSYAVHALMSELYSQLKSDDGTKSPRSLTQSLKSPRSPRHTNPRSSQRVILKSPRSPKAQQAAASRKVSLFLILDIDPSTLNEEDTYAEFEQSFTASMADILKVDARQVAIEQAQAHPEGTATLVQFTVKPNLAQKEAPQLRSKMLSQRLSNAVRDFQCPGPSVLGAGDVTKYVNVEASLDALLTERVKYLQDTVLSTIAELPPSCAKSLGVPPAAPPGTFSSLLLAAGCGLPFLARAILNSSGTGLDTKDAKDLMDLLYNTSQDGADIMDEDLIDDLVLGVILHSHCDKQARFELLPAACRSGLEKTVKAILAIGPGVNCDGLLHMVLQMLGKVISLAYSSIVDHLLEYGADPNQKSEGVTPLEAAIGGKKQDWPYRSSAQLVAASSLIRHGANFSAYTFQLALSEWESATTNDSTKAEVRTSMLEQLILEMVRHGVDYGLTVKGRSVIDICVSIGCMSVLEAVVNQEQQMFGEKLKAQFVNIDVDQNATLTVAELVALRGEEDGQSLFTQIDLNHDQEVSLQEWLIFLTKPIKEMLIDICAGRTTHAVISDPNEKLKFAGHLAHLLTRSGIPVLHDLIAEVDQAHQSFVVDMLDCLTCEEQIVVLAARAGESHGTVLHAASKAGIEQLVQVCLALGADYSAIDDNRDTPLAVAVSAGHAVITKILMAAGAEVPPGLLHKAAFTDDVSTVELLLDAGLDVDEGTGFEWTPLHVCCQGERSSEGRPLDGLASYHGGAQVAQTLLTHGANVNASDITGQTPLAIAVQSARENVAELLLENKADPLYPDVNSLTPLAKAIDAGCGQSLLGKMLQACSPEELSADAHAMFYAIRAGDAEVVKRLASSSGSSSVRLYHGWPAAWWAVFLFKQGLFTDFLLKEPQAALWIDHACQRTLLHWIAVSPPRSDDVSSAQAVLSQLVQAGANVLSVDVDGCTPLELAAHAGNRGMVSALLSSRSFDEELKQRALVLAKANGFEGVAELIGAKVDTVPEMTDIMTPLFVDPDFAPNARSLSRDAASMLPAYARVEWVRASKLCGRERCLFPESSLSGLATDSGVCGAIWFWASVAAAGDSVKNFFITRSETKEGIYKFMLSNESVTIDDFIPTLNGIAVFGSVGSDSEMWSLLLCKAFAKQAGSFQDLFVFDQRSSWSSDAAAQFGKADVTLRRSLFPLLDLADHLHTSPLLPLPTSKAGDVVESLSRSFLPEAEAMKQEENEVVYSNTLPDLILYCDEDAMVRVVVTGKRPRDLSATIEDKDGRGVATFTGAQLEPHSGSFATLRSAQGPHALILHTSCNADDVDDFDIDVRSSRNIRVQSALL